MRSAKVEIINPATEEKVREFEYEDRKTLLRKVEKLRENQEVWAGKKPGERARVLFEIARDLEDNVRKYASLITEEMGKPISQAEAEVKKCAWVCRYYAENAEKFLEPEHVKTEADESYVVFEPLGVILGIMPWNFPFWQVFRCAVPVLTAGNTFLLKHAPNTFGCALEIKRIFERYAPGIFDVAFADIPETHELIKVCDGVSFTGSTRAGAEVAKTAGQYIKKSVLELGGSDPFVVFPDVDVDTVAHIAVRARTVNSGQSCIAGKRFIVHEKIYDKFVKKVKEEFVRLKVGDPFDPEVQIGPIARKDLFENALRQIEETRKMGGKILLGGERAKSPGFFLKPTIAVDVPPDAPALREETFSPFMPIIPFRDEEEAIRIANDTEYGLGASIWTGDIERAKYLVRKIKAGNVFVNGQVHSDPRLPFGGIKKSGYGRELSHYGLKEFVNIKTVWIKRTPRVD